MALSPETVQPVVAGVLANELISKVVDNTNPADWAAVLGEAASYGLSEDALVSATRKDPQLVEFAQRYARERRAASVRAEELALRLTRLR